MGRQQPIWAILVLSIITCVNAKPNFFVVAPSLVRVDEPTKVHVFADNLTESRTMKVTIKGADDGEVHSSKRTELSAARRSYAVGIVEMVVDSSKLGVPGAGGHTYVRLTARCQQEGFTHSLLLLVEKQTGIVFLQTDKPIYTPRQKVHLRIYTLNEKKEAKGVPVAVDIKNPDGVILMQQNSSSSVMGISHLEFQIPDPAICGDWSAVVHHGHSFSQNETITFKVKKYVLPHFKVKLSQVNDVITSKTLSLECKVTASYSFGANVVGMARVSFWVREGEEETRVTVTNNEALENGKATFRINITEITDFLGTSVPTLAQKEAKLCIDADVTETSSGIRQMAGVKLLDFSNSPYIISTERVPWSFSPGLLFNFQIDVSLRGGGPAKDVTTEVRVTYGGRTKNIASCRTDDNGRVYLSDAVGSTVDNLVLTVDVMDDAGFRTTKQHTVWKSTMVDQMVIDRSANALKPSDNEEIAIQRIFKTACHIHYVLISGGRILHSGQKHLDSDKTRFNVKLNHQMVPYVRIVVWYVMKDGSVVSASRSFDVERVCKRDVSLTQDVHEERLPGSDIHLKVKDGPEDGTVALLAVDKAVYSLDTRNLLTRSQMFNGIESMDVGCGDGGGRTAKEVFELAGLAMLSDDITTTSRPSRSCAGLEDSTLPRSRGKRRVKSTSSSANHITDAECCSLGTSHANRLVENNEVPANQPDNARTKIIDTKCRKFMITQRNSNKPIVCRQKIFRCCTHMLLNATNAPETGNGRAPGNKKAGSIAPGIRAAHQINSRVNFPESFLIETATLSSNGELTKLVKLPDSITTWSFTAVSMSNHYPMCVSPPHEQIVKKDVFLKLHLPYEAVLGEQLELKATVYNTGASVQRTRVELLETEDLCCDADRISKVEIIEARSSRSFTWLIRPIREGQLLVKVNITKAPYDAVIRKLNIIPAGLMTSTKPVSIALDPQSLGTGNRHGYTHTEGSITYTVSTNPQRTTQVSQMSLKLPPDAIDGTHKMTLALTGEKSIYLTGEIMADVVDAFLMEATYYMKGDVPAYGEESMAKLGPTVCAARYTHERLSLPSATADTIDQGVRAMMAFRTREGAFGLMGGRWPTIWLTAFTVRTLSASRPFSPYLQQQPELVCDAVSWLLKQKRNGVYSDWRGLPTLHFIRDQPDEKIALTAYVLIALHEAGCAETKNSDTLDYLAKNVKTATYHYTKAIVTYALAKSGHTYATRALNHLLTTATTAADILPAQKFWKNTSRHTSTQQDVETAAYGVLAMVVLRRAREASPYVEWLMTQRKADGLFPNSQTTVLGLQALTEYSLNTPNTTIEMICNIKAMHSDPPINIQWTISNRNLNRHFPVTNATGGTLTVECRGQGAGRITLATTYYADGDTANNRSSAFQIDVTTKDECNRRTGCGTEQTVKEFSIEVCTRATHSDVGRAIIDVGISTGYEPTKGLDKVKRENKQVQEYTSTHRSVIFHISNITRSNTLCIKFKVKRHHTVHNIQPVPVKVQDYYNPELMDAKFYRHTSDRDTVDADVQVCAKCYGYKGTVERPESQTLKELRKKACSCAYDYVFEGRLMSDQQDNGVRMAVFNITAVAREGFEKQTLLNQLRTFIIQSHCHQCPHLTVSRKFFIMGKEQPQVSNGRRQYYINKDTYVVQKGGNKPGDNPEKISWKAHKRLLKESNICSR